MSSTANIPSFEEMETMIQDNLIELIKANVENPRIRFWEPYERISDKEIERTYPVVYNLTIFITHTAKKSKKTKLEVSIDKNFRTALWGINLSSEAKNALRTFGRAAARVIYPYFIDKYKIYLGMVRFDVLPIDNEKFAIPNIQLVSNLYMYKSIPDANASHVKSAENDSKRIPYAKFVEDRREDYIAQLEFTERLKQAQNHKESS